jgi:hypothetical protein
MAAGMGYLPTPQPRAFDDCAVNKLSIQASLPRIPGFRWAPWRIGRANVDNSSFFDAVFWN